MTTCNCDGSVDAVGQTLPDSFYHLAGTQSPTEQATQACKQAIAVMTAEQLDPCDPNYDEVLQMEYANALTQVQQIGQGVAVANPIQKAADVALGTAAPNVPTISNPQQPSSSNMTLIIGAIVILGVGFVLVFTAKG